MKNNIKRSYLLKIATKIIPLANRGNFSLYYKNMERLINSYIKEVYGVEVAKPQNDLGNLESKLPKGVYKSYNELIDFLRKAATNKNYSSHDNTPAEVLGKVYAFIKST